MPIAQDLVIGKTRRSKRDLLVAGQGFDFEGRPRAFRMSRRFGRPMTTHHPLVELKALSLEPGAQLADDAVRLNLRPAMCGSGDGTDRVLMRQAPGVTCGYSHFRCDGQEVEAKSTEAMGQDKALGAWVWAKALLSRRRGTAGVHRTRAAAAAASSPSPPRSPPAPQRLGGAASTAEACAREDPVTSESR